MVRLEVHVCVHISVSIHLSNSLVVHPQEIECAHKISDRQEARAHKLIEQLNDLHSHFDGALNVGIIE